MIGFCRLHHVLFPTIPFPIHSLMCGVKREKKSTAKVNFQMNHAFMYFALLRILHVFHSQQNFSLADDDKHRFNGLLFFFAQVILYFYQLDWRKRWRERENSIFWTVGNKFLTSSNITSSLSSSRAPVFVSWSSKSKTSAIASFFYSSSRASSQCSSLTNLFSLCRVLRTGFQCSWKVF